MSKQIKRKYKTVRREFNKDLYVRASQNKALAVMIIKTYTASQHRRHIMKIWELLGFHHKEAYKDYCDKLMGRHLCGRDELMNSLHFAERDLYDKYIRRIPERYAMGEALGVAYRVLKGA
ncbi:hypothetical protein [Paenibacillus taiwanensis]|uniref:hypothetical protein n=1 Tax=Paenibacillus taiwanensis TaxID=401638 RepID=UPI000417DF0B|nr:hypothetical protein [Paenibacillus taiwanensis]